MKKIFHYTKKLLNLLSIFLAIEATLAVLLSYYACFWVSHLYNFDLPVLAGLWGSLAASFVIAPLLSAAYRSAINRVIATLIGALSPMICLYIFGGYNIYGFGASIFLVIVLCSVTRAMHTYHTACITASVVYAVGLLIEPSTAPWLNACSRFLETMVGILITLAISLSTHPIRQYLRSQGIESS